jgi:WD40 repeat protein
MASTLIASTQGLEIVDRARRHKNWNKAEVKWLVRSAVSTSTLGRFWMQKPIQHKSFVAICEVVGVDWEQVIDLPVIEPTNIKRGSNLAQVNHPIIVELEEFAQAIFDWFGALDFKFEGLPRREGNYVEWIIQVPDRRSRFDRVLIRAIIHETGLRDLDDLRRAVVQLRIDEGCLVTNLWVSQSVKQVLNKSDDENLECLTFDELIDRDANFTPYLEWLEREISKREIDRYYVDLGCTKGEFDPDTRTLRGTSKYSVTDGGIDQYIDRWLENPVTEHVSILGEFGTGKTWFAFHYAGKCLQAYRDAKSKGRARPRLPLVIPLRDTKDVKNVLAGFFYKQHNIRLTSDVFDRLNQMGKLLLIFDGFDEMAERNDPQKVADHFWELAKVVTTNAKVILTCRTEHFPTAQDGRENFGGERIPSTANKIAVAPKFETLELLKFDDEQIRAVLSRRTNLATVELVMANTQLLDLLRRAVMAEFVLEALPEIEAGKPIDLARVYLYAVRHKMERDITTGRTFTSLADKLYFLCELAWEMLSEDQMTLNYREFPDRLKLLFGKEVESQKHLDHWHYDMMGQTMLIRNDDGDYSPAHRSLLEFFVAYKFAAELGLLADDFLEMAQKQSGIDESLTPEFYKWSDYWKRELDEKGERKLIAPLAGFESESPEKLRETFGKNPLTKAILDLLLPMIKIDVKYRETNDLIRLIQSTNVKDNTCLGGNAATILGKLNSNELEYQDLSCTNLAHADLVNIGLRKTNLSNANLRNCQFTKVIGQANAIIANTDNKEFITAHDGRTIIIWNSSNGREPDKLIGHQNNINCLAISQNEQVLYSGGDDGEIYEWNLPSKSYKRIFKDHQLSISTIVLSEDEQFLYSGSNDKTIKKWKIADGVCEQTLVGHDDWVSAIVLSKDGQFLYSSSNDKTIKKWNLVNGFCEQTMTGHQATVRTIVISKDGEFLYSGSFDRTIKKWNLVNGLCEQTMTGHQSVVRTIVISKDGEFLYSGSFDRTIKKWNLVNGLCEQTMTGHQSMVRAISLSKDEQLLYSGSDDQVIKKWKINNGFCEQTIVGHQSIVRAIVLSADGKFLYSGGDGEIIKEWNLEENESCQRTFFGHKLIVRAIALSADGKFLYAGGDGKQIKEWNLSDGSCQRTFDGHQDWLRSIIISADGKFLYSGGADKTIKEWNLEDGKCRKTFVGHDNWVVTIALSADGKFMYSSGADKTIKEWSLEDVSLEEVSCHRTFVGHDTWVMTIALSADGKFLYSSGADKTIKEWNLEDGSCHRTFVGHDDWVRTIELSIDGKFLYSGSNDKTIKEWNLEDGSCHRTFDGHDNWIMMIAMSKDGKLLYSGSDDQRIKAWDLTTGQCIHMIDTRLCADANITNVKGLTPAQTDALLALGAFSDD